MWPHSKRKTVTLLWFKLTHTINYFSYFQIKCVLVFYDNAMHLLIIMSPPSVYRLTLLGPASDKKDIRFPVLRDWYPMHQTSFKIVVIDMAIIFQGYQSVSCKTNTIQPPGWKKLSCSQQWHNIYVSSVGKLSMFTYFLSLFLYK